MLPAVLCAAGGAAGGAAAWDAHAPPVGGACVLSWAGCWSHAADVAGAAAAPAAPAPAEGATVAGAAGTAEGERAGLMLSWVGACAAAGAGGCGCGLLGLMFRVRAGCAGCAVPCAVCVACAGCTVCGLPGLKARSAWRWGASGDQTVGATAFGAAAVWLVGTVADGGDEDDGGGSGAVPAAACCCRCRLPGDRMVVVVCQSSSLRRVGGDTWPAAGVAEGSALLPTPSKPPPGGLCAPAWSLGAVAVARGGAGGGGAGLAAAELGYKVKSRSCC
mmetsp:Transcript_8737/g.21941  ORF Transcript_8737/g.21941 Transcript_8737/m.21941 type:complete len:275 (+) Transcript_8737:824-1648(+)